MLKKKLRRTGQPTYDNIIRRMRIECWMIKATDTHLEVVILIAFLQQKNGYTKVSVYYAYA